MHIGKWQARLVFPVKVYVDFVQGRTTGRFQDAALGLCTVPYIMWRVAQLAIVVTSDRIGRPWCWRDVRRWLNIIWNVFGGRNFWTCRYKLFQGFLFRRLCLVPLEPIAGYINITVAVCASRGLTLINKTVLDFGRVFKYINNHVDDKSGDLRNFGKRRPQTPKQKDPGSHKKLSGFCVLKTDCLLFCDFRD